jgi:ribonucleoside-diphosphate reductase alpha chain
MDTIATMTSIALQYGVPLKALVDKFSHTRFEPAGFTNNPKVPIAKSVMDYVFRYLGNRFLEGEPEVADEQEMQAAAVGWPAAGLRAAVAGGSGGAPAGSPVVSPADAPSCQDCGAIMIRNGACYKCANCGGTSGCS